MLIKTQVKRRTQALNQYILNIKDKVYQEQLREAKQLLKMSRESINNSYMAPYDPNSYLLDSLKTKNQKLRREKDMIQQQIANKLDDINRLRLRRGFIKNKQEEPDRDLIIKIYAERAGAYVSRLTLKLEDVDRIDYEAVSIQTDYRVLKVKFDDANVTINFRSIISVEAEEVYILLCWKAENQKSINFMMIKFESEEQRKLWLKCINFSKLICQSQMKSKLFFKEQKYANGDKGLQGKDNQQEMTQLIDKQILNKIANLTIQANKTSAFDRLRRKSQMYQNLQTVSPSIQIPLQSSNLLVGSKSKLRKVSEDLSAKQGSRGYFYDKRSQNQKSRRSFGDDSSPANSVGKKKEQSAKRQTLEAGKKYQGGNTKIQRLIEEREKYSQQNKMNQSSHSQSNRQIIFNQSSINWIEQEKDETNSKESNYSKNTLSNKRNFLEVLKRQNMVEKKKIFEVPAQGEQSPLLQSEKKDRNFHKELNEGNQKQEVYKLRIRQVENSGRKKSTISYQASQKSKSNQEGQGFQKRKQSMSKGQINSEKNQLLSNSFEAEEKSEEVDQIKQVKQPSDDDQSQPRSKNPNKSQLEVQQKSQDLISQNEKSQTQSKKYELDYLISGIVFLKCAKNGWNPHLKKVHLSNNHSQLCWKNLEGDDLKKINLSDIEAIEYNPATISPGIKKHIKNIEKKRCLVIKYLLKKQTKFLQFYLPEKQKLQEIQNFYQKLSIYVKFKTNHAA